MALTTADIDAKAAEFHLSPQQVERDYVFGWLLKAIFDRPALASQLVLKGGQAIRKVYLRDTRFSKDLDFSVATEMNRQLLSTELRTVCETITSATGIQFSEELLLRDKELPIPDVNAFEARIYFKGFYGSESLKLRAQLDITEFDRIYLPIQTRPLIHPYPDAAKCVGHIRCQKLEEILASKLTAMLHRRRVSDLFDLLRSIVIAKDYDVSRREVISTFLRKSIFSGGPDEGRRALLDIPMASYEATWSSLIVPAAASITYQFVMQNYSGLIDSLFAALTPVIATGGLAAGASALSGAGIVGRPVSSFGYFSSGTRRTIVNAANNGRMVEFVYDGFRRLVEPYKLEYYVRKSDNRGSEYFWGWDTSGGRSGKIGIKMFFCEKIQTVTETMTSFIPRFPIEI